MSSRMSLAWTGSSSAEPLYKYCITCRVKVKVKMNVDLDEISDESPSFWGWGVLVMLAGTIIHDKRTIVDNKPFQRSRIGCR